MIESMYSLAVVIPAQAGIQRAKRKHYSARAILNAVYFPAQTRRMLDSRLRGNDEVGGAN